MIIHIHGGLSVISPHLDTRLHKLRSEQSFTACSILQFSTAQTESHLELQMTTSSLLRLVYEVRSGGKRSSCAHRKEEEALTQRSGNGLHLILIYTENDSIAHLLTLMSLPHPPESTRSSIMKHTHTQSHEDIKANTCSWRLCMQMFGMVRSLPVVRHLSASCCVHLIYCVDR